MVHIRSIDKEKGEMKMSSEQHPIEGLMTTAMNSIQDMIDVKLFIKTSTVNKCAKHKKKNIEQMCKT